MVKCVLLVISLICASNAFAQTHTLTGKIINAKLEPVPYAAITIKNQIVGTTSKQDGTYTLQLEDGIYEVIVSLVGYTTYKFTITMNKKNETKNILLQEAINTNKNEIVVTAIKKDRSEEYIRNVIRNKEATLLAANTYSSTVYIKASQTNDDATPKITTNKKTKKIDTISKPYFNQSLAEISLQLDYAYPNKFKETRTGVKKIGNPESLYYLTTTDGNFSLYNNLIKIPALTPTPMLSPISYSGLVAYKYKTIRVRKENGNTIYTITYKPIKLGNALITGEVDVQENDWVITNATYSIPKYHLNEYNLFTITQQYTKVQDTAWLLSKQQLYYAAKLGKGNLTGSTTVTYNDYILNPTFAPKYFGVELSSTTKEAYERDSIYWNTVRTEPLTTAEVNYIQYKDSIYQATHNQVYYDSVDAVTNRITIKKILVSGITRYNRKQERTLYFGSLADMIEPLSPGGTRIGYTSSYEKTFKNKKNISAFAQLSYGIRNKDINGTATFSRRYNPYTQGYYYGSVGRSFDQLFEGDVLYTSFQKRNLYRKYHASFGHGIELVNGLYLNNKVELAYRQSLAGMQFADFSKFITDTATLALITQTNTPINFDSHGAIYNNISLSYTPKQKYLSEPYQKVVMGSSWPTFNLLWRKGLPKLLGSTVDYDYVEFTINQSIQLGTVGVSQYTFTTGNFINKRSVEQPDKKFIRGRDPYIFLYPQANFQHIDSTFEVSRNFYKLHYYHEFNGAIMNKIPLLKKLQLREFAGGGLLFAAERNLTYIEAFVGIESMPFRIYTEKFKLGVALVGSIANQFKNPIQLKFNLRHWDKLGNKWE